MQICIASVLGVCAVESTTSLAENRVAFPVELYANTRLAFLFCLQASLAFGLTRAASELVGTIFSCTAAEALAKKLGVNTWAALPTRAAVVARISDFAAGELVRVEMLLPVLLQFLALAVVPSQWFDLWRIGIWGRKLVQRLGPVQFKLLLFPEHVPTEPA
jgi:predicted small integral membrane protein